MIEVTSGRNNASKYRRKLERYGLVYTGHSWKTNADEREFRIRRFCDRHGLKCKRISKKYVRSGDYRRKFFHINKGYKGNGSMYHCAYCGKKLSPDMVRVDHIIPIHGVQTRFLSRLKLKLLGIQNVNDTKNLVAACKRCNDKKGSEEGLWLIRGMLGRSIWFWRFLRLFIFISVFSLVYYLYTSGLIENLILLVKKYAGQRLANLPSTIFEEELNS